VIDTHCHLGQYKNPNDALDDDVLVIAMTSSPGEFQRLRRSFKDAKKVRFALGLHPMLAVRFSPGDLREFDAEAQRTSYIGEVGLDFSAHRSTWARQEGVFRHVLQHTTHKVVSVHSRRAETRVAELLEEQRPGAAIFHWYSGGVRTLDELVGAGHFFSVGPAMLTSLKGRRLTSHIPLQQALVETDGPFVRAGGKVIRPRDVRLVYDYFAGIWSLPLDRVIERVRQNFAALVKGAQSA